MPKQTNRQKMIENLKNISSHARPENKQKINDIIELYSDNKINNYRTALNIVHPLSSKDRRTSDSKKVNKAYDDIVVKSNRVIPAPRVTFKIIPGNLARVSPSIKIEIETNIKDDKGDENIPFSEIYNYMKPRIIEQLKKVLAVKKPLKLRYRFNCDLVKYDIGFDGEETETVDIDRYITNNASSQISNIDNSLDILQDQYNLLQKKMENLDISGSGWKFRKYHAFYIDLFSNKALRASSYIPTPEKYSNAKCGLINIRNEDQECFKWCMLYHQSEKKEKSHRVTALSKVIDKYNYEGVNFPASYEDIKTFEENNQECVYIYEIDEVEEDEVDEEGNIKTIKKSRIIKSKEGDRRYLSCEKQTHLLRIEHEEQSHYVYIKNISHLLHLHKHLEDKDTRFCPVCNKGIKLNIYTKHLSDCTKFANDSTIISLPEEGATMKFDNHKNMLERPFIVYADTESLLIKTGDDKLLSEHVVNSVCTYFVCTFDYSRNEKKIFVGKDCIIEMMIYLNEKSKECIKEMKDDVNMILSNEDEINFRNATCCHICSKVLQTDLKHGRPIKVRDHDHRTGKYRGAAHPRCNINYFSNRFLPVVFHNLKGYDSHLIISQCYNIGKKIGLSDEIKIDTNGDEKVYSKISCIPCSYEKFMSFKIGNIKFIDSFQFMASSLDKLVENLYDKEDKYKNFTFMKQFYGDNMNIICQKGFYPYEWVDSWDKLENAVGLPPIEDFYSRLKNENISVENYNHAKGVYNKMNCQKFLDYHLIYLECDVLLLADIFENFRKTCLNSYKLDPANYISSPGLSWDAMLLKTDIKLDLISDLSMLNMIEKQKKGGLCFVGSKRHVKANNKYLENFNPEEPSNYIMYWDANNLYGWAMSQFLPYKDLRYSNETLEEILETDDRADEGYIVECDLSFPEELHDKFKEYPPCPENIIPKIEWFSKTQLKIGEDLKHIKDGKYHGSNKLVPHLFKHEKYVIHYRNLKFIHQLGVKIDMIHKVLKFKQLDWLEPYIKFNNDMRKKAKNDFEKDFFKLMNNSVFGKTMENVKNRMELHLTIEDNNAEKWFSKINFKGSRNLKGLHLIEMFKKEVRYDKPIYVGSSILDLSKLWMMDFHYNTIQENFNNKYSLIYSDTDSLIYSIEHPDIYEWIKNNKKYFDLSDSIRLDLRDDTNKKVLGCFKDESNSLLIKEVIATNPKSYSVIHQSLDEQQNIIEENTKKLKGVSKSVVKKEICHQDFVNTVNTNISLKRDVYSIKSTNHKVHTVVQNKIAITSFYDKCHMIDSINCVPFGYKPNDLKE